MGKFKQPRENQPMIRNDGAELPHGRRHDMKGLRPALLAFHSYHREPFQGFACL